MASYKSIPKAAAATLGPGDSLRLAKVNGPDDLVGLERLRGLTFLELSLRSETLPEAVTELPELTYLEIKGKSLSSLPPQIGKLKKLRKLLVKGNKLTSIPDEIGELESLEYLNLSSNALDSVPEALGHLPSLDTLDVSSNKLVALPDSLGHSPALRDLDASSNRIASLPAALAQAVSLERLALDKNPKIDLGDMAPMPKLRALALRNCKLNEWAAILDCVGLHSLSLGMNHFGSIPPEIARLRELRRLYVWKCKLKELPTEIGELAELVVLEIEKNELSSLPRSIEKLTKLEELCMEDNRFDHLPEQIGKLPKLRKLTIQKNNVSRLPEELARLQSLSLLYAQDNPISDLPQDLSAMSSLSTFYFDLAPGAGAAHEHLRKLPPKAYIMVNGKPLAHEGRWLDEPAPATDNSAEALVIDHGHRVQGVALLSDAIASCGFDGLRVFNTTGKERFHRPGTHFALASLPDGRRVVCGGTSGAELIDVTNAEVEQVLSVRGSIQSIDVSSDGELIVVTSGSEIALFQAESGERVETIREGKIKFGRLSPNKRYIAFGVKRAVHVWDRDSGRQRSRCVVDQYGISDAVFTPDGSRIICVGTDDGFSVVDYSKKKGTKEVRGTSAGSSSVHRSPDGSQVVTAGRDREVCVWNYASGELVVSFAGHVGPRPVDVVRFDSTGEHVISGGCDKSVRVFKLPSPRSS